VWIVLAWQFTPFAWITASSDVHRHGSAAWNHHHRPGLRSHRHTYGVVIAIWTIIVASPPMRALFKVFLARGER
jgi:hypothetical protein